MTSRIVRRALARSLDQVRYVSAVRPEAAEGLVAAVYAQVERDFGMLAPPVALHSPAPGPLAAAWVMLRETLVAGDPADRSAREAVANAVSHANDCPYCAAVHGAALGGLVPAGTGAADRPAAVSAWASSTARRDQAAVTPPPGPPERAAAFAGVAVTFHYLNRMVNVFLDDSPVPAAAPAAVRAPVLRLLGLVMRPAAGRGCAHGASLELLPEAAPPGDLRWAAGDPYVSDAFARACAAVDAAGRRSVPAPVRDLVAGRLAGWDGAPPGLGRAWLDEAVAGLPEADRPAGRLALLTALASAQVGPGDVASCRRAAPDDRTLIELAAWASLAAARRIGTWLVYSPNNQEMST